jgi:hypothetical protein
MNTSARTVALVTTVDVFDASTGAAIAVVDARSPVVISFVVPASTDQQAFDCSYWASGVNAWRSDGAVLLGFSAQADSSGSASGALR